MLGLELSKISDEDKDLLLRAARQLDAGQAIMAFVSDYLAAKYNLDPQDKINTKGEIIKEQAWQDLAILENQGIR